LIWADRLALLVLVIVASLLYLVAAPGMFRRSLLDPALLIGFWGQIIAAVILPIGIGPRLVDLIPGGLAPPSKDHREMGVTDAGPNGAFGPLRLARAAASPRVG
jgi:hypothetical protein